MKIKEHDGQRMVIAPPLAERLKWILVLAFAIFLFVPILSGRFSLDFPWVLGYLTSVVFSVILGLYALGKVIGNKTVIDKLTQSIMVKKRPFLLIHRQRNIPFSAVMSVDVEYSMERHRWWETFGQERWQQRERTYWQVSLNVGEEKVKIDQADEHVITNNVASAISRFIGKKLVDNYPMPESSFKGGRGSDLDYPAGRFTY